MQAHTLMGAHGRVWPLHQGSKELSQCLKSTQPRLAVPHKRLQQVASSGARHWTRVNVATLQSENGSETAQHSVEEKNATVTPAEDEVPRSIWKRVWMPASPANMLDTSRPNKLTLLGKDLVAWYNQASQSWEVVEDRCPHRFAPLSLGRIVDGELTCSYHGWRFSAGGKCTDIPQMAPGPAKDIACKQRKACASSYPCEVNDGVLFVWMDNSSEGLLASLQSKPFTSSAPSTFDWIMVQNPNDYTFWLEQGMDPSHAPFLHHGLGGFEMKNATEMVSKAVPQVTLEGGFTWWHQGYEMRNKEMTATRQFIPPFAIETRYNKQATASPSTQAFTSLVVPVRPGVCRTIFRFATIPNLPPPDASNQAPEAAAGQPDAEAQADSAQPQPAAAAPQQQQQQQQQGKSQTGKGLGGLLFSLMGKLPHWLFTSFALSDQDVMIMHEQEKRIRRAGLKPNDYALLASGADGGVAAINRWFRMAGPPGPAWLEHEASAESMAEVPLEHLLDRRARHVEHCIICQKGLRQVTRACQVVTVLAAAASTAAVTLLTLMLHAASATGIALAAKQSGGPVLAAAALGTALAVAAAKLWDFREDRFISGVKNWKRKGGLSLVPQE